MEFHLKMYKRRKKPTPVANSTFKDVLSRAGSFTSSQSSVVSTIASQHRSDSPEDIFSSEPSKDDNCVPSTSAEYASASNTNKSPSKEINKNTSADVLKMLISSDDSEPLAKSAKLNGIGTEKLVLSQSITSGPLKFFYDLLANAGLIIGRKGESNYLKKSQAVFIRNLVRSLEKDKESSKIDRFIENLEEYLSDTDTLRTALSPTKNHPDVNLPGDSQECLVRLLLSIEVIQVKLISFLLDKVAEYAIAGEETGGEDSLAIVRMILSSMRYMVKISDPESLTRKLFDIIHSVSGSMLKHEIINCLPDIISDTQREQTANELMELMKTEPYLSPSILFTLSNLWLDADSLHQLQLNLIRTLRKTTLDQLPAFVRFVTSGDINSHADEIINGLRSELVVCHADTSSTQAKQASQADISSTLFLIFEKLRDSVLKSKKLADIWLKNIGKVRTAAYHKPIDIIMLLILHSISPDLTRKKAVEAVFKNKIRIGHFKESLIQDTLSVGLVIIKEYFSGLLKLLSSLLQSPDLSVSNYSALFYTECFVHLDFQWRKMIILELKDNITMSKGNARPALNLLHSLSSKHVSKVAPYVTLIMLLLDSVSEMKIIEVRELMDILCMIAFYDSDLSGIDNSGIQDELYMIVQKQLSRPEMSIFRSGIISGITVIKHMVKLKENEVNETPSTEEEEIQLSPMAKKALNLFELVVMSTRSSAEAQVLVFDQLSYVVMTTDNMDKCFMKKISLLMQSQLQNHFIIASSDFLPKDNGLEPVIQFCIDNDFEDPIVFNLVDAVVLEANSSQVQIPIVALPGLVRVVRSLELADLSEIDALLGCGIVLPSPSIYSKFSSSDPSTQNLALDCLFHVCNWLREMLNSFVYLIKDGTPTKILKRLRATVYFQNLISVCLPQTHAYSPPKYYFDYSAAGKLSSVTDKIIKVPAGRKKQKKNGKKGDKVDKGDDESIEEMPVESDEEKDDELIQLEFSKFKQHFRELDFDVCLVLTQPLILTPQVIKDGDCSAELGPSELLLILDDLNSKLRYCLNTKKAFPGRRDPVGFDNLASVSLDLIVKNTAKLAHHLTSHLHKIVEYLHNLITVHDGILDATGMFCPGSHEIKQCLALIFSIFTTYLSWPDLESEAYTKCLIKCLIKLGGPNWIVEKKDSITQNSAIKAALTYLKDIAKCVLDLTSAVGLVNLMKTLIVLQEDEDKYNLNLGELCEDFLKRKWYDPKGAEAKGTLVNQQQTILLDMFLSDDENSLENIGKTLSWLTLEVESLGTDNSLTTFPHFNKSNLNVLIRSICKGLLTGVKLRLEGKDYKEKLEIWDIVVNSLQSLIAIIKIHDLRINLRQFLKGCLPILRFFLAHGMSVCSTMFKIESVAVSQTIKKLQVITRYIQSICNYSKVNKDNSLIQQLPGMRAILETILLSVKNMILQNKCTDAFFMGSMRNKDIHGEIISSEDPEEMGDSEEIQPTTTTVAENSEISGNESDGSDGDNGSISDTY